MMYKLFFLFLLTCFFGSEVENITWKEGDRLTWSDFRGQPDLNSEAAAITASGISFSYTISKSSKEVVSFTTEVGAHFYPEHSWHKKGVVDDHILEHEQLHFDITELNVRKFRKRLSEIIYSDNIAAILEEQELIINKELAMMQDLYDADSDNSINRSIQKNWKHYVESELKTLYEFRSK